MILITGASGNVGREVLRQAAAAGLKLRAAYQSADKAGQAPAGVETVLLDYGRPETLRAALQGIETLFLVGPPTAELAVLEGNAVAESKRAAVPRIVKLSALGGRQAIFPRRHADSEDVIKASGIPYTFLRPNGFMQNFVNYSAGTIKTQDAFYGTEGNGAVSHIDIRDIAAAAVKVLCSSGHEGKAYPLTGPEALTNAQVAQKISDAVGRTISYVDLPAAELRKALLAAGLPEWSADALLDLQRLYREGGGSVVDPTFEHLTGRKATSFDQFARDYAGVFRSERRAAS